MSPPASVARAAFDREVLEEYGQLLSFCTFSPRISKSRLLPLAVMTDFPAPWPRILNGLVRHGRRVLEDDLPLADLRSRRHRRASRLLVGLAFERPSEIVAQADVDRQRVIDAHCRAGAAGVTVTPVGGQAWQTGSCRR